MGISAFAKRHPIVTYYGLVFAVLIPGTPSEIPVTFDLVFAAELWLLVVAVAISGSLRVHHQQQPLPT